MSASSKSRNFVGAADTRPWLWLAAALVVAVALPRCATGGMVWDTQLGWIDMDAPPARSADRYYRYATGLFISGEYAAAADACREVETSFPHSPLVPRAALMRAKCMARLGRRDKALRICKELLAGAQDDLLRKDVASFQLQLLQEMSASAPKRAAERMATVRTGDVPAPPRYSARMAAGEIYVGAGKHDLAAQAYEEAIELAGDQAQRRDALYAAARSELMFCRESRDEDERLQRARKQFAEFLGAHPGEGRAAGARQYIGVIDDILRESDPAKRRVLYAQTLLPEGRFDAAYRIFKRGAKRYKDTPAGETSRFLQAECLFLKRCHWKAFKVYERFMADYPAAHRLAVAIARELAVGRSLMEAGALGKAIVVFDAVLEHDPAGRTADDAEMYVGECYMAKRRYGDASSSFNNIVVSHPESEWATAALFKGGVADLKASDFSNDNEHLLSRAHRAFEVYLRNAPDGAFAAEARRLLAECKEKQARELLETARFYERMKRRGAARVYYRAVAEEHPNSSSAKAALGKTEELKIQDQP